MLDHLVRPYIEPPLNRAGRVLADAGVSANAVTLGGFVVGLAAIAAIATGHYLVGLVLLMINRLSDGLDGAVARVRGPTDLGGYLDIVCDFILYSGWVFAFALADPAQAIPAAFLMFSFMGTGSSFLAYAIFAAKRGTTTEIRGSKSLYYLGGLTEGTETIMVFILFCLLPQYFAVFAWVFAAACWVTTVSRMLAAARSFKY